MYLFRLQRFIVLTSESIHKEKRHPFGCRFSFATETGLAPRGFGLETDERSETGERSERRRWRMQRGERVAAVEKIKEKRKPADFFGHRNRASKRKAFVRQTRRPCADAALRLLFRRYAPYKSHLRNQHCEPI
jgi:hypothetical protein